VQFTQRRKGDRDFVIDATVNTLLCSRVVITAASKEDRNHLPETVHDDESCRNSVAIGSLTTPLHEAPEYHSNNEYVIGLNDFDLSGQFPQVTHHLGEKRVAAILALSYFVGMVCPGLHSIFSRAEINLDEESERGDSLTFRVDKYDERFRLFDISFKGCISGSISAFLRPPPQTQPSLGELAKEVDPEEFAGTRSLILGGSRGLGELTAKLVAVGGGDVVITYASGADDARRVSDEINTSGRSRCEARKLDLLTDSFESMDLAPDSLDAVYFFATPRIQRKKSTLFSPRIFQEFVDFYVDKFYEMCVYLESGVGAKTLKIYFPSSVFVSERPNGMTEYAMAKSAAEVMVQDVNKHFKKISVVTTRLPRLNTDQTSSLVKLPTESNVDMLLPIIRSMVR
jgi:NAD(P)-dependent dehydrogenase (short-subunit alcohol dehydrogenase family)